jgi:hypothetical protein
MLMGLMNLFIGHLQRILIKIIKQKYASNGIKKLQVNALMEINVSLFIRKKYIKKLNAKKYSQKA